MPVHLDPSPRPFGERVSARLRRRVLVGLATSETFERAVARVPGARERAWRSARRYVVGPQASDAAAVARRLDASGLGASIDLFGERTSPAAAPAVARDYVELCALLADATSERTWLSIDLSHIAFDAALLETIARAVPPGRRLQVGAEEAAVADRVLDAVIGVAQRGLPVEATLQANLRRSPADAERLGAAGVPVRLVKGAYPEAPDVALPWGPPTDRAYTALARRLHLAGVDVALATHDPLLRATLLPEMPGARCEVLLGVDEAGASRLAGARQGRARVRAVWPRLVPLLHAPSGGVAGRVAARSLLIVKKCVVPRS
jgi:proline dehydrogenase